MARRRHKKIQRPPAGPVRVSATDAARRFSDLLNRVHYGEEAFVVERGGRSVCEMRPVYEARRFTGTDLVELLRSVPHPGTEYLEAVEAVVAQQPPAEDPRWRR